MFAWNPPAGGIPASVPTQQAFIEGARGVDAATGNAHPIYFVAWLMIGPTYGDATASACADWAGRAAPPRLPERRRPWWPAFGNSNGRATMVSVLAGGVVRLWRPPTRSLRLCPCGLDKSHG